MEVYESLTIKNFKCFDKTGSVLPVHKRMNLIIGKNNIGKSSIIDVVKFMVDGKGPFSTYKRNGGFGEIIFNHKIDGDEFKGIEYNNNYQTDMPPAGYTNPAGYIGYMKGSELSYIADANGKRLLTHSKNIHGQGIRVVESYVSALPEFFKSDYLNQISAERDIRPEASKQEVAVDSNGNGATNLVRAFINSENLDSSVVESLLLRELNKILVPDIEFTRILVQESKSGVWEIYFESEADGRIPLSKMGSGVKTILLVVINLHINHVLKETNQMHNVFAFEELENNLHPSLQRRLYKYIYNYAVDSDSVFYLTSHSNVAVDLFINLEETQILHVYRSEKKTLVDTVTNHGHISRILDDLDIRASDILQCNGIIWVEGPSDRTYLKRWLELVAPAFKEGYHYSIMFYGGKLLSHLTFDETFVQDELIPLLRMNKNAIVLIDKDAKVETDSLNKTKTRIEYEIGPSNAWVTDGREIENYLTPAVLKSWLSIDHNIQIDSEIAFTKYQKIEKALEIVAPKIRYADNKHKHASEIIKHINFASLEKYDLRERIDNVVKRIREWNRE